MTSEVADAIDAAVRGQTITALFRDTVAELGDEVALRWHTSTSAATESTLTWNEYRDSACRFAAGLHSLGVAAGDRVVLMMGNRMEFHIADMGCLLARAIPVSIYNTSAPDQVRYLLNQSGASVAIAGDPGFLQRFLDVRADLDTLRHLVVIDEADSAPEDVLPFAALLEHEPVDFDCAAGAVSPDDLLTLLYTSGTTGSPKAVMLTHRNLCWSVESIRVAMGVSARGWRQISYLPMAHISDRMFNHYIHVTNGSEVTICPSVADIESYLVDVRPHCLGAVPRIWEKIYSRLQTTIKTDPARDREIAAALALGLERSSLLAGGRDIPAETAARWEQLHSDVLAPLKATVGLDACIAAFSGGAPLPRHLFDFFLALGIPLMELLGMSESPVVTGWNFREVRPGTAGPPSPGVEARLLSDGELLLRGGQLSPGYFNDPIRTAEAFDAEGWLHTGDVVEQVSEDGYLRVVDRKKELIITSSGKNISPSALENALKRSPLIAQVAVIGDGRPYITALITLDAPEAIDWARRRGIDSDIGGLVTNSALTQEIADGVAALNATLSRPEQIKKFVLLADEWDPDSGLVTPTMKLKRRHIVTTYRTEIEDMYSTADNRSRAPNDRSSVDSSSTTIG
jgi:long-chain acyl-CoA synthetase